MPFNSWFQLRQVRLQLQLPCTYVHSYIQLKIYQQTSYILYLASQRYCYLQPQSGVQLPDRMNKAVLVYRLYSHAIVQLQLVMAIHLHSHIRSSENAKHQLFTLGYMYTQLAGILIDNPPYPPNHSVHDCIAYSFKFFIH